MRLRADKLVENYTEAKVPEAGHLSLDELKDILHLHDIPCSSCGKHGGLQNIQNFNLLFDTSIGPAEQTRYVMWNSFEHGCSSTVL